MVEEPTDTSSLPNINPFLSSHQGPVFLNLRCLITSDFSGKLSKFLKYHLKSVLKLHVCYMVLCQMAVITFPKFPRINMNRCISQLSLLAPLPGMEGMNNPHRES